MREQERREKFCNVIKGRREGEELRGQYVDNILVPIFNLKSILNGLFQGIIINAEYSIIYQVSFEYFQFTVCGPPVEETQGL